MDGYVSHFNYKGTSIPKTTTIQRNLTFAIKGSTILKLYLFDIHNYN